MEGVVVPRMRRITTSRNDGAPIDEPASRIETETVAWDADGNVLEQVERSYAAGAPDPVRTLRTRIEYALDPSGRYRQRTARVRQDDGAGTVVADTLTFYDGLPLGEVGSAGLVTARHGLALTDEQAAAVYGAQLPDFAELGYERRDEAAGWWIPLGTYVRTVDAQGIVRGELTGLRGAPTGSRSTRRLLSGRSRRRRRQHGLGRVRSAFVSTGAPDCAVGRGVACRVRRARPTDEDGRVRRLRCRSERRVRVPDGRFAGGVDGAPPRRGRRPAGRGAGVPRRRRPSPRAARSRRHRRGRRRFCRIRPTRPAGA